MGRCATCRKFIIGGPKQGDLQFCSEQCLEDGFLAPLAQRAAPELVAARAYDAHQQNCPVCGGAGPVDIYTSHTAFSLFWITSWKSQPRLCCARCGTAAIRRGLITTALFGWWGIPFGIVMTPWQLYNGVKSLANRPNPSEPSMELTRRIRIEIARAMVREA